MADELAERRRKRALGCTPEAVPETPVDRGGVFVVQEHHASQLHWDFRLERAGVLASWTVPRGVPRSPGRGRLAVRIDDQDVAYADFEGEIPQGEYGAGTVEVWDRGRYETVHWHEHRIEFVLYGERLRGRYELGRREDGVADGWTLRRLDPAEAGHEDTPRFLAPMPARPGRLPSTAEDAEWAYEFAWGGRRTIVRAGGGRVTAIDETGADVTGRYPELRGLGAQLGSSEALLDGEIVVFSGGKPDPAGLRRRTEADPAVAVRLVDRHPAFFFVSDVLHLDYRSRLELPYTERRALLDDLGLRGDHWQVPAAHFGDGGAVARASREHGLPGLVAKRRSSPYRPGRANSDWLYVESPDVRRVVIGGWRPGGGRRAGTFASLLLGVPDGAGLRYAGSVGVGFSQGELVSLAAALAQLEQPDSPFEQAPEHADAHWVRPVLAAEVVHGPNSAPRWRGLLSD
ncbi:DNA polymerase ligase N-terminal domain-containing protein [Amycolatopsis sp. FDAARGOS 1241]|uniref:DNA polymerase ligase N-terminal domain-containing protein n=1 Tax=Amycolatopsis sp. FDAARGOS 1241 TaxID=2778070 RepID=UPI00194F12F0|nr:DNA polymerase ligase N-terminal domain-containing protein [Amycolatopsis sp. FDAARGOS 1241]QRP49232.1 DNA ligase [Amycolatopsis sp. FDAARGOS 1241]